MTWYEVDPAELVTPTVIADVAAAAGVTATAVEGEAPALLARLFSLTGGLPYASEQPTAASRTARGRELLHEAVRGALGEMDSAPHMPMGWALEQTGDGLPAGGARVSLRDRLAVNLATAAELAELPVVGPALAVRIVQERRAGGPYRTVADMGRRVRGLSESGARSLAALVRFDLTSPRDGPQPATLEDDLRRLLADGREDDDDDRRAARAVAALERLVLRAIENPHPARRSLRRAAASPPGPAFASDQVVLLFAQALFDRLPALIGEAQARVDVAMFHIALPEARHPTARILDALEAAHSRGVAVRVLVDRDRRDDPYRSRIINRPAVERLAGAGIEVRIDAPDSLLHAKSVCLDDDRTIVGSHNWSAGSFFAFDDLSVLVVSAEVCAAQRARFDVLWDLSTAPPPRRARLTIR